MANPRLCMLATTRFIFEDIQGTSFYHKECDMFEEKRFMTIFTLYKVLKRKIVKLDAYTKYTGMFP